MPWGAGALCLFQAEWAGSNCCLGWGCATAIPSRAEEKSKIEIKQSNFQAFQGGVMRRKSQQRSGSSLSNLAAVLLGSIGRFQVATPSI